MKIKLLFLVSLVSVALVYGSGDKSHFTHINGNTASVKTDKETLAKAMKLVVSRNSEQPSGWQMAGWNITNWKIVPPESEDVITLYIDKFELLVEAHVMDDHFQYKYLSSKKLKADVKNNKIHKNYFRWIDNLDKAALKAIIEVQGVIKEE